MNPGETAIITGASSGLGRQLALELSGRGTQLALYSRNEEALARTAALCLERGGSAPLVIAGDVSRSADCALLVENTVSQFGRLDYLIANAGVSMWTRFDEVQDLSLFGRLMETNYLGVLNCIAHALPHLRRSRGLIVVVSSIQAKIGVPYHSGYSASKHALDGLCDALRCELHDDGVNIMSVYPSWLSGSNMRSNALAKDGREIGEQGEAKRDAMSIEECATRIVAALDTRPNELYLPGWQRIIPWLKLMMPGLLRWVIRRKLDRARSPQ